MNKQDIEKVLGQVRQIMIPPSGTLDIVSIIGNSVVLKITGLPQDMFKVQGTIVKTEDEIKKKIIEYLHKSFENVDISFI